MNLEFEWWEQWMICISSTLLNYSWNWRMVFPKHIIQLSRFSSLFEEVCHHSAWWLDMPILLQATDIWISRPVSAINCIPTVSQQDQQSTVSQQDQQSTASQQEHQSSISTVETSKSNQIPAITSLIPTMGPLHISLNSREDIFEIFRPFFNQVYS